MSSKRTLAITRDLRLHRRKLVGGAVATSGAAATGVIPISTLAQSATPAASPEVEFVSPLTEGEVSTLSAITDRLIPAGKTGPGAAEAGAPVYIQRLLAGTFGAAQLELYQTSLAVIDQEAGGNFASLLPDDQDQLLTRAELGEIEGLPEGFFVTVLNHTREGMFCDPVYGGNINFAGWDLLGYSGIKLAWSAEEQNMDTPVDAAHISIEQYGGTAHDGVSQ